jgi:FdhE protein
MMTRDTLEHIDRLIRQRPSSKAALEPYRELMALMIEAAPEFGRPEPDVKHLEIKKEAGFPLFAREDLPVDLGAASGLLESVLEHLGRSEREDREGLEKALNQSRRDPDWSGRLFRAILKEDEKTLSILAADVGLDPKALFFLGLTALRPSLGILRKAFAQKLDTDPWDEAYCPLCGSQPDMAFFETTGKRYLHCSLCGEAWAYPRVKCAFCQNDDQKSLGYFQAEEEEGFRVDFCEKCKRYIKTADKRVLEIVAPMEIENLATLHLDVLATQQGFK